MQFDPVHFQNKLGQTVLVRNALEEDAAALLQYCVRPPLRHLSCSGSRRRSQ